MLNSVKPTEEQTLNQKLNLPIRLDVMLLFKELEKRNLELDLDENGHARMSAGKLHCKEKVVLGENSNDVQIRTIMVDPGSDIWSGTGVPFGAKKLHKKFTIYDAVPNAGPAPHGKFDVRNKCPEPGTTRQM